MKGFEHVPGRRVVVLGTSDGSHLMRCRPEPPLRSNRCSVADALSNLLANQSNTSCDLPEKEEMA
jgi:hypothetical protein